MTKILQRTSQCQRSPCCLLADREHLPLLILETLLRHVLPVATPAEAPVQVVPVAPAIDASSEDAVAPASKKARQYNLEPHLQPPLQPSSSSPAALPEPTTTTLLRLHRRNQRLRNRSSSKRRTMKIWHGFIPSIAANRSSATSLAEQQPAAAPDLEASRSRSRTYSEVSEAPTITYPDPAPDPPRESGHEEPTIPEPSSHPP